MTEKAIEGAIRKKLKDKRAESSEVIEARKKKYFAAIKRASATADGKILLHYLMTQCGYQRNSVQGSKSSGELLKTNTLYNEGRRDVWLGLRKYLTTEALIKVEIHGILPEVIEGEIFDEMFE